jgi:hypothetical protein
MTARKRGHRGSVSNESEDRKMANESFRKEFNVVLDGIELSPEIVAGVSRAIQKAVLQAVATIDTQGDMMMRSSFAQAANGGGNGTSGVEVRFTGAQGSRAAVAGAPALTAGTSGGAPQQSFSMQELASSLARAFLEAPDEGGGGSSSSCTGAATRAPTSGGQSMGAGTRLQDVLRDAHAKVQLAAERERAGGQQPSPGAGP